MDRLMNMPIADDWSASPERRLAPSVPSPLVATGHAPVATARELVEALAGLEVAELKTWRAEIAAAGAELAELASSMSMPPAAAERLERVQWACRYPTIAATVVIVRQLVWLASIAPDVWSTRAAALIADLHVGSGEVDVADGGDDGDVDR